MTRDAVGSQWGRRGETAELKRRAHFVFEVDRRDGGAVARGEELQYRRRGENKAVPRDNRDRAATVRALQARSGERARLLLRKAVLAHGDDPANEEQEAGVLRGNKEATGWLTLRTSAHATSRDSAS